MYIQSIQNILNEILKSRDSVNLRILGLNQSQFSINDIRVTYLNEYDEAQLVTELHHSDIGLFPVLEDELSQARGVHKSNVYFAAGIPVIATSSELITHQIRQGFNGYICNSMEDWRLNLLHLIDDTTALSEMKKLVRLEFSSKDKNQTSTDELLTFFKSIIEVGE
jgi:hypothetical protein